MCGLHLQSGVTSFAGWALRLERSPYFISENSFVRVDSIFDAPRPSCLSIPLRGSCQKNRHYLRWWFSGLSSWVYNRGSSSTILVPSPFRESFCDDVALFSFWDRRLVLTLNVPLRLCPRDYICWRKITYNFWPLIPKVWIVPCGISSLRSFHLKSCKVPV